MSLSNEQKEFLYKEFGIEIFDPQTMNPLSLWQLRENLIDLECDDELDQTKRTTAAHLVDYMSKLPNDIFPKEWKLKSPPEVEAMLEKEKLDRSIDNGRKNNRQTSKIPA